MTQDGEKRLLRSQALHSLKSASIAILCFDIYQYTTSGFWILIGVIWIMATLLDILVYIKDKKTYGTNN